MRETTRIGMTAVLLAITPAHPSHAEAPRPAALATSVSAGSSAGYAEIAGTPATALGGYVAVAKRRGRLALEGRYDALHLEENGNKVQFPRAGGLTRLSLAARLDLGTLGRRWVGPDSRLSWWVDAGVGRQSGHFESTGRFVRNDVAVGTGWRLDHRNPRWLGVPTRVGWFFGWRVSTAAAPEERRAPLALCTKGQTCPTRPAPGAPDLGLLVNCGLAFTW